MFTITLSEAELQVATLALGRFLSPRKVVERKPAGPRAYVHKVGRLSDGRYSKLTGDWEAATIAPETWRARLQASAGAATNRQPHDVAAAWGIVEVAA